MSETVTQRLAGMRHVELTIRGTVQGVGFRPFIYRLARELMLRGWVRNSGRGVVVRLCGIEESVECFLRTVPKEKPAAARIEEISVSELPHEQYSEFSILRSAECEQRFTQVSPDLALCRDCARELHEMSDRRFAYPFINCTQCGPRFTIIQDVPYDRPFTTMSKFEMCSECKAEYESPVDRRFHAQPVACSACGPTLEWYGNDGGEWTKICVVGDVIHAAARELFNGKIALIQGIGGFHLACDARNEAAVRVLRQRKGRDRKPFAVMFADRRQLRNWCAVGMRELEAIGSAAAPIVLLKKTATCEAAQSVSPEMPTLGAMLAYSPLHALLLEECGFPLVMTSANRSDEPIQYRREEAFDAMRGIADFALVHNRAIEMFADDSIVRVIGKQPRVFRRSRGFVPTAISLHEQFSRSILAFGADLKNTFCIAKERSAILSQHMGDLEGDCAIEQEQRALAHFLKLYHVNVEAVACDLHPDYSSTRLAEEFAQERSIPLIRVQHHHAHLAACLAEAHRDEATLGVCLDGTGYGTDGTIWGGELLYGEFGSFRRIGHLKAVPLLGNDRVAREPWRMALAWLDASFDLRANEPRLPLLAAVRRDFGEQAIATLLNARLGDSFPVTSAAGRLFDAVAALLFFGTRKQYEGEAAMQLEHLTSPYIQPAYDMTLEQEGGAWVLSPVPMMRELVYDLESGVSKGVIARRFMEGFAEGLVDLSLLAADETGCHAVALSGGCFQNAMLHERLTALLTERGLDVLAHQTIPANDGGIALGQACIANAQLRGRL
jgi:hydrogenase maturation protein HypF